MFNSFKQNLILSNRGASTVLLMLTFSIIVGFAALSIDYGVLIHEKWRLSSAVDSAALAGAQELVTDSSNTRNIADNYMAKNIENLKTLDVYIDSSSRIVEVRSVKTVQNSFAKILGKNMQDISAVAKAKVENIKSLSGVKPLAVVQDTFEYGKPYTLKEGGGDGTTGNYGAVALGGTGGSNYSYNLMNGYNHTISVNDMIETETGNMAGPTETAVHQLINECNHTPLCTYLSYNNNCPRVIFLPVVNTMDVNGRSYVKVLGFATFFLEGASEDDKKAVVTGRFITYSMQGETSNQIADFGTYGIKLIK